jgi:23S rRNA (guanosine2251-2'-O)-methyltransferase
MEKNSTKIFGLRAIIEAIKAGNTIEKIYLLKDIKGELASELNGLIKAHHISFSYVPIEKLHNLSKSKVNSPTNHQGAVAKIAAITFTELELIIETVVETKSNALFLILDQISDVRNLGAIIRTAECTGVDCIIIPTHGSAPINADAIKTSAGAAFKIPICKVNHVLDAIYQLQAINIEIISVTEKTNTLIYEIDFNKPTAIVLGSEHKGISASVLKISDKKAKLPLLGEIESLNVSVACGVALYEVIRQRLK